MAKYSYATPFLKYKTKRQAKLQKLQHTLSCGLLRELFQVFDCQNYLSLAIKKMAHKKIMSHISYLSAILFR